MSTSGQRSIVAIAHNLRSVHNVGSLLRTGEVFAVDKVYVTGFTPYPTHPGDERSAKLQARQTRQMAKAAAGAESTMPFERHTDVAALLDSLREAGYTVAGLEIDPHAIDLAEYAPPQKIALLLGDEVHGIDPALRDSCDLLLQIPIHGNKYSLNVSVAAGIALYTLRTA
ncbi:SpoU rRNA methylase family protein [Halopolyspora algeriensis]|uniref:SpoU rRNA methylase family protein n=1 Tax=Halopolyspora algeriensis TaxID=1500506 RepID=A0A368VNM7_9ACTN|nr:TrmH family RNA methyltransferase [Halopolyspora algeriensis]RCW43128.1 SpoU rRNA methylase family protein [Halopolyspora algeriensis]TQM56186.1 SpoU rRNA methylase family protein [Halopolyspora algeriensis]